MSNYIQTKQRLQYPSFIFQLNMCLSKKGPGPSSHLTPGVSRISLHFTSLGNPLYGTQQWKDSPEKKTACLGQVGCSGVWNPVRCGETSTLDPWSS